GAGRRGSGGGGSALPAGRRPRSHRPNHMGPRRRDCRCDSGSRVVEHWAVAHPDCRGRRGGARPLVPTLARRRDRGLPGSGDGAVRDGGARRRGCARMRLELCRHAAARDSHGAALLAAALAESSLAAVYTSPLARAVDTARAVAAPHGLSPVTCEDLREIELGEVEGLQFDDYPSELQTALLNAPGEVCFPGGESYE